MDTESTKNQKGIPANLVGEQLKALRIERGLTQSQLGALCGQDRGNLANIEDGKRAIGGYVLRRILAVLKPDPETRDKIKHAQNSYNPWGS